MGTLFLKLISNATAIAMLVMALFYAGPASSGYESECQMKITSNDNNFRVVVEGQEVSGNPKFISCKNYERTITVLSDDEQVFTRVMPADEDFTEENRVWNVFFLKKFSNFTDEPTQAEVVAAPEDLSKPEISSDHQSAILQELVEMRSTIERLSAALNKKENHVDREVARTPQAVQVIPTPKPVQVTATPRAPASSVQANSRKVLKRATSKLAGFFIQLHAFVKPVWNFDEINAQVASIASSVTKSDIKFCRKNRVGGKDWTRIYLGPFKDLTTAFIMAQQLQRENMVVKDPVCIP